MTKLIILDRDGVINQDSLQYIKSPEEFQLLPGSVDAIAQLTKAGYQIGIATNQSGVARGLYDEATLGLIHDKLLAHVHAAEGRIDVIEYCPHMPDVGCACRKPRPGMLQAIAKQLNCDLQGVAFIGDRVTDIQAAEAVGAQPMLVVSPMTDQDCLRDYPHVAQFSSLQQCVHHLLT